MARISTPQRFTVERRALHDQAAQTLYDIYEVDGQRLLQVNTYGRQGRKTPDKPSQVLQLDEAGARDLLRLLREAFPNLAVPA